MELMNYTKVKKERTLTKVISIYSSRLKDIDFVSFDGLFSIAKGLMRFEIGYKWNGCDFARDWNSTDRGSASHDALIWYNVPVAQKTKDLVLYDLLKEDGFKLAYLYYVSVRTFMIAKGIK